MSKMVWPRGIRITAIAVLAVSLIVAPEVIAGHLDTSPAILSLRTNPQVPDQAAIRGISERSSTGPQDIAVGVVGRTTGNAVGDGGRVVAMRASATGDAIGNTARVVGLQAAVDGDATGTGARLRALGGNVVGNAVGQSARVEGAVGSVEGEAAGPNSRLRGVIAGAGGSATGSGSVVEGLLAETEGSAPGANSRLRGILATATGSATGTSSQIEAITGSAAGGPGTAIGVQGFAQTTAGTAIGVNGVAPGTSGITAGVRGEANSPSGSAIVGVGNNGAKAADLYGRVSITCSTPPCVVVNGTGVADLAEDIPVRGRVAPGDVVVVTSGSSYAVARASRPYDTRVAGIVSSADRIRFGNTRAKATAPVAMVGIVPAKATAMGGAIRPGDLLTTSRVPGRLMRCPSALRCVGAIVGKAMEPLSQGQGTILVLVWRQ